jgi:hypothetical protein
MLKYKTYSFIAKSTTYENGYVTGRIREKKGERSLRC